MVVRNAAVLQLAQTKGVLERSTRVASRAAPAALLKLLFMVDRIVDTSLLVQYWNFAQARVDGYKANRNICER